MQLSNKWDKQQFIFTFGNYELLKGPVNPLARRYFWDWVPKYLLLVNRIAKYDWIQCNSEHISIANFYLFVIQMVVWYWSINQMVIWTPNFHGTWHLNCEPFDERANPHDPNTKLVCYSDPHCTCNTKWQLFLNLRNGLNCLLAGPRPFDHPNTEQLQPPNSGLWFPMQFSL